MTALLLIDIQNDFIPGGSLPVPEGDEIIEVCNLLQAKFHLVVATQDWHPENHKSFAANHLSKKPFDKIMLQGMTQVLWPIHCVQGTEGAAFSPLLNMNKVEAIFRKGTNADIDSYSGFYDNGHLKSTALAEYLKARQITDVYIAGLAADYCVYFTAKDAISEGFRTTIIEDGVRPINKADFENVKEEILQLGGQIIHSSALRETAD